jgi:ketol-acid reductoisomerase
MKVYYDKDADLSLIKGKNVTIVGYGSQGHAHAQNLNDSGVKVTVGCARAARVGPRSRRPGCALRGGRRSEGCRCRDDPAADEQIGAVYKNDIEPHIRKGASLAFAHGFNVHYGQVMPRDDLDVWMVAPKAPATPCATPTPRAAVCRT